MAETDRSPELVEDKQRVGTRWWYWIAAYPVGFIAVLPLLVFVGLLAAIPIVALGVDAGQVPTVLAVMLFLMIGMVVLGVILALFVIFVMLPFALYFDARAIRDAHVEWSPDPIVYALLAALQFIVTPLVGLVVALYYLYRRHVELGTP